MRLVKTVKILFILVHLYFSALILSSRRKSNHHLFAVPARNNDLWEEANGDGLRRQAGRRAGRLNFSRNHRHGLLKPRPCQGVRLK